MAKNGQIARKGAIYFLDQVLGCGRMSSDIVCDREWQKLIPSDRARANRLASNTLRDLDQVDKVLSQYLRKVPPLTVQNALRLGTSEIARKGTKFGVVNDIVEFVANRKGHEGLKGLVNAVLRRVAQDVPQRWEKIPRPQMPKRLRNQLLDAWGNQIVEQIEIAHYAGATIDLTRKKDVVWSKQLTGKKLSPYSFRLRNSEQISSLPGYAKGDWWVQDFAATLPIIFLNPQPDENIIDLCAAPGGKTMQLIDSGAKVVAIDKSPMRMSVLKENLNRVGFQADCRVSDAFSEKGCYDAVVVDPPCSATGTIRRHPELPYCQKNVDYAELIGLQRRLLDHAWTLLKPNGRLVYCACSLLPDEGERQLLWALENLEASFLYPKVFQKEDINLNWITPEGGFRTRPDYWSESGGMDGFYIFVLWKNV
ncbi:MAG: RsmB/NOP family class I SAM-dependent RNA methyltransferase [Aestuariivita sp.]|nr:RsmB/NOP family class I SAM-dependent RNA methyltransferase [Aestuariivita sp.]